MSRILLIEDSATQAAQFVMMLESAGFEVQTSNTLADGLERLKLGGIDALLLDLNLPDSEGLSTFQTAAANAARTPIVVLTHVDDEELATTALQQGAQDYLVKGEVNANWLARSIQHAIARGRADTTKPAPTENVPIENVDVKPRPQPVVQIQPQGDVVIARINEKQLLDTRAIGELSEQLLRRVVAGGNKMVVSLAPVEYISNGAIGVLLAVRRRIQLQNGRLCLCEFREGVADQFIARQFHRLFEIFPNVDAALESLATPGSVAR